MEVSASKDSVPSLSDSSSSLDTSSSSQDGGRTSSFEDVLYENAAPSSNAADRIPLEDMISPSAAPSLPAPTQQNVAPIDLKGKGKIDNESSDDPPDSGRGEGGVKLVKEGDEIDEASSSILAFLHAFPRIVLRAAARKFVFVKGAGGLRGGRIKATCTHADLANDHKAGQEVRCSPLPLNFPLPSPIARLSRTRTRARTAVQARVVRGCGRDAAAGAQDD
jgi:hypothetical protein